MDDLVRWLGEQLDTDERIARAATSGPWHVTEYDYATDFAAGIGTTPGEVDVVGHGYEGGGVERIEDARHIAAHDPSRVLREIDAKRRLLAIHRPYVPEPDQACLGCAGGIMFTSCPVVRLLALPYADRPGYREEWRP